jgi:hypothetical protein
VVATFRQPFDLLAESVVAERHKKATRMTCKPLSENWLPFLNTYRAMCPAPQPDSKRVLEDVRAMQLAA